MWYAHTLESITKRMKGETSKYYDKMKNQETLNWGDSSMVKSTGSDLIPNTHIVAHNHLLILVSRDMIPSSGLWGTCMHMVHKRTCSQNTCAHKIIQDRYRMIPGA